MLGLPQSRLFLRLTRSRKSHGVSDVRVEFPSWLEGSGVSVECLVTDVLCHHFAIRATAGQESE